jgi:hypothetical protein
VALIELIDGTADDKELDYIFFRFCCCRTPSPILSSSNSEQFLRTKEISRDYTLWSQKSFHTSCEAVVVFFVGDPHFIMNV